MLSKYAQKKKSSSVRYADLAIPLLPIQRFGKLNPDKHGQGQHSGMAFHLIGKKCLLETNQLLMDVYIKLLGQG